jgi:biopolymer transport protein ExbD
MPDINTEHTKSHGDLTLNMTPLLDVMLLLLIFFLLAPVFIQPTLRVDLPILVRDDKQSKFEHFIAVMDAVKGAGAAELIIETKPSGEAG